MKVAQTDPKIMQMKLDWSDSIAIGIIYSMK
jgi:hypothetical protein